MTAYEIPSLAKPPKAGKRDVMLVASGDLRLSANQNCWAAQQEMETALAQAVEKCGYALKRAHPYKEDERHGFIGSQKEGMQVFRGIDPNCPLIVAEAVWQYSHHLLHGLISHRGPILTVANWSGTWPGLVGMLNLNGSMTKAGIKYSTLWSEDFSDEVFQTRLQTWLEKGRVKHKTGHTVPLKKVKVGSKERKLGEALAGQLAREKAIMGIFDEGCMGMFNAIIPDHLLNPTGVYKERLSQSALYYETTQVSDEEARAVRQLDGRTRHDLPYRTRSRSRPDRCPDPPAVQDVHRRRAHRRRLRLRSDRHSVPAGPEGPAARQRSGRRHAEQYRASAGHQPRRKTRPVRRPAAAAFQRGGRVRGPGRPDDLSRPPRDGAAGREHAARLALGRLGRLRNDAGLRVGVPDQRLGSAGAFRRLAERVQRAATGHVLPQRRRDAEGHLASPARSSGRGSSSRTTRLKMDLGRAGVIELPAEETERRWKATTSQWPIMHAVTYGVSRDQMMARHKANHIQVAYAKSAAEADKAMLAKACMARAMGMEVAICGTNKDGEGWD